MLTQLQPSNHEASFIPSAPGASCHVTTDSPARDNLARTNCLHPVLEPLPTTTVGLRSVSRGRRRTGDACGSCGHGAVRGDGTGWAADFSLRPRPLSRGRRRTVVPYWLDGHGAARLEDMEADPGNVSSGHNRD